MTPFDDYHRTVIGYHGTGLATALRIVNRVEDFGPSRRDFAWLGHGIYFWEYAPQQALRFTQIRQRQYQQKKEKTPEDVRRATEPLAVVGCMIRLGHCFDLLEPDRVEYLRSVFVHHKSSVELAGSTLPKKTRKSRKLDCAVFKYVYRSVQAKNSGLTIDSARGVYVPAGGEGRVWPGSWISRDAHIQLCVRNPRNVLGAWLHHPTGLEAKDVRKAFQATDISHDPGHPPGETGV